MEEKDQSASLLGNRYQLQKSLGSGGMSLVYLARDLMLERPVAVKILKQDFSQNSTFRTRFRQEAQAAANLTHPNIVTVHDFGFHKGRLYIVMEYVPGQNLKNLIKQNGKFNVEEAVRLMVQACAGVGYAHRAGLVHCDIKPHNMIVTPDQRLKVTDFGIARALTSIMPDERTDVVWGSPQYFSPEQAAGLAPSPASDVYSIGVILYEMLTGKLPFNSDDPTELARLHRETQPVPPSQFNSEISLALEQIILKILSKEPAARYRTADQLGRILESFLHQTSAAINQQTHQIVPPPPPPTVLPPDYSFQARPEIAINKPAEPDPIKTIDWVNVGLGFLAVVSVGGLIPFWLYIWLTLSSR
jgi:eukaryotic-like serine/threonine-protein kinase